MREIDVDEQRRAKLCVFLEKKLSENESEVAEMDLIDSRFRALPPITPL